MLATLSHITLRENLSQIMSYKNWIFRVAGLQSVIIHIELESLENRYTYTTLHTGLYFNYIFHMKWQVVINRTWKQPKYNFLCLDNTHPHIAPWIAKPNGFNLSYPSMWTMKLGPWLEYVFLVSLPVRRTSTPCGSTSLKIVIISFLKDKVKIYILNRYILPL